MLRYPVEVRMVSEKDAEENAEIGDPGWERCRRSWGAMVGMEGRGSGRAITGRAVSVFCWICRLIAK